MRIFFTVMLRMGAFILPKDDDGRKTGQHLKGNKHGEKGRLHA